MIKIKNSFNSRAQSRGMPVRFVSDARVLVAVKGPSLRLISYYYISSPIDVQSWPALASPSCSVVLVPAQCDEDLVDL